MKTEKCTYYEKNDDYEVFDKRTSTLFSEVKMIKCKYNDDNDTIKAWFDSNLKFQFKCEKAEKDLNLNDIKTSKLIWLKDNEPKTYFNLIVGKRMQEYLDFIYADYKNQYNILVKQFEEMYGEQMAQFIAREFLMYQI